MANEGFNTFVLGQPPATYAAATDYVPLIQGGATKRAPVSTITPYNVVSPTGGDDTSMLQAAFTNSATNPVFLSAGTYIVTSPLTLPARGNVVGEDILVFDYYDGFTTYNAVTTLAASGSGWKSGQSIVNLSNYCSIRGFTIRGLYNGVPGSGTDRGVSGLNLVGVNFARVEKITALYCYNGFVVGSSPSANTQGIQLLDCKGIQINANWGIYCWPNGGFISDHVIVNCATNANVAGEVLLGGMGYSRIRGCRFEDSGGPGLVLQSCNGNIVSDIFIDRCTDGVHVYNSSFNTLINVRINSKSGSYDLSFGGPNCYQNKFIGWDFNQTSSAASIKVYYPVTYVDNQFDSLNPAVDTYYGTNTLYADAYSESVVAPSVIARGPLALSQAFATVPPTSNIFTPDFYAAQNFMMTMTHGVTNTIANPTGVGTMLGQAGWLNLVASSTGGDSVSFGSAYKNVPSALTTLAGANSQNYVQYVVSPAGDVILSPPILNAAG